MSLPTHTPRHAVVIGGSLAGLCAARVLADHVESVTVIDRDDFPAEPAVRKGLPQAHHLHVLIPAGQHALDQLFPGLIAGLHERGAVPVAAPTEVLYLSPTGWRDQFPATHRLVGASRELIDWALRQRLVADGRVRFRTGYEVVGLLPARGAQAIEGVMLRGRSSAAETELLRADLVVDASGRASRASDWLEQLGYGRPEESRVESGLAYASRRYSLPEGATGGWKNILLMPKAPDVRRGGVLYPIENGKWMVTLGGLGGLGGDVPPTDEKGFLVTGDAACTFNPVYGQGMTVAAQAAVLLDKHLRANPGTFGRAAQAAVARCSEAPWQIATGADLRYPTTVGPRPGWAARLGNWYLDRTSDVANRDGYVARVLADVLYLVTPPTALFRPGVALRVFRGRRGPALQAPPAPAVP
jgi:flavin-dependent dehydrogenase